MRYQTHLITSTTLGLGLAKLIHLPFSLDYYAGICLGALLPDIDEPNSYIGRRSFGIGKIINKLFGHRGLTHSLPFTAVVSSGIIFFPNTFMIGISLGYLFHILEDAFSVSGVPLFAPFSKKKYKIPVYRTSKISEAVILVVMVLLFTVLVVTT